VSALVLAMAASLVLAATAASAAEPWIGRWAVDVHACSGSGIGPLLVTQHAIEWPAARCAINRSYKVGNAWHVSGRCWGEGGVSMIPMRLQMRGDRLVFDWGRARTEELRRCP
jgi:hypothetical protein